MQTVNIRSIVFTALFAALFIVLSLQQMKLTLTPIPITFQTFGVIMAGLFLKPRQAFASIAIVLALGAFGLPLFGGKGGLSHLLGPTGGFLIAFPICAMLVSLAAERILNNERWMKNKLLAAIILFIAFELFGSLFAYVIGIPWMMQVLQWTFGKALVSGFYPFLFGDAVKSALGVIVALSLTPYIIHLRKSTGRNK